jgi:flagellar biosynthesis protein FlhG
MTQAATAAVHPTSSPLERKLITIASGKGGVGKTWLSITLAHALARHGRQVLLFDGDLGLANVDIQLGLTPMFDLGDVLAGRKRLMEAVTPFCDGGAAQISFDILAGKSGSGALASLTRDTLIGLRQTLIQSAQNYNDVLLDLGAGIDQQVAVMANHGGRCVVVLTPEPTALTDAYAFIKLRTMRNPACDIRVIVNQATSARDGQQTFDTLAKACNSFLKFRPKLAGVVRRDPKVSESIRAQTPLLVRSPGSPAATDVDAIAKSLIAG